MNGGFLKFLVVNANFYTKTETSHWDYFNLHTKFGLRRLLDANITDKPSINMQTCQHTMRLFSSVVS